MMLLLSQTQIQTRVAELAAFIATNAQRREIVLVPLLNGAMPFCMDLLKLLPTTTMVEPMIIKRYSHNGVAREHPTLLVEPTYRVMAGKDVWVVDDILDEGPTLIKAMKTIRSWPGYANLNAVVLLHKRKVVMSSVLNGFDVLKDDWVVGYGLDDNGYARGLLDIHAIRADDPKCPSCGVNTLLYGCWCEKIKHEQFMVRKYGPDWKGKQADKPTCTSFGADPDLKPGPLDGGDRGYDPTEFEG